MVLLTLLWNHTIRYLTMSTRSFGLAIKIYVEDPSCSLGCVTIHDIGTGRSSFLLSVRGLSGSPYLSMQQLQQPTAWSTVTRMLLCFQILEQ
jgi:hypothetical protein